MYGLISYKLIAVLGSIKLSESEQLLVFTQKARVSLQVCLIINLKNLLHTLTSKTQFQLDINPCTSSRLGLYQILSNITKFLTLAKFFYNMEYRTVATASLGFYFEKKMHAELLWQQHINMSC